MVLTVLQILADWPASLIKNIFQSHKIFFVVVQLFLAASIIFPTGVVHRVGNGWGLTKVAVVLLNGLLW